uniref:Uncharacterized protein n=1 Tax=Zooxanthella nutricula TaxID=1333877 RepID=A0A7S2MME6_9DINO
MGSQCTSGSTCPLYDADEKEPILNATSDAEDVPWRWQPKERRHLEYQQVLQERAFNRRRSCTRVCVASVVLYAIFVLVVSLSTLGIDAPAMCAVEEQGLGAALDLPLRTGTKANTAQATKGVFADVDLTGVWYIKPSDAPPSWAIWLWQMLRAEVLVSFAGSYAAGDVLHVPAQLDRQMGYSSTAASLVKMLTHAFAWDPHDTLDFKFVNSSYAYSEQFGALIKRNKDEWSLPHQMFGQDCSYTLARVVYTRRGLWTTHPRWWPDLLSFMSGYSLRWWGDDNVCRRRCETAARAMMFPGWSACRFCMPVC